VSRKPALGGVLCCLSPGVIFPQTILDHYCEETFVEDYGNSTISLFLNKGKTEQSLRSG
jgi:hypothetical protein